MRSLAWLLLLCCAALRGARAQLVINTGPTSPPGTYDPCLPPPTGVNIVSPLRHPTRLTCPPHCSRGRR